MPISRIIGLFKAFQGEWKNSGKALTSPMNVITYDVYLRGFPLVHKLLKTFVREKEPYSSPGLIEPQK